jgi:ATP-dependent Clp protease protease subunit
VGEKHGEGCAPRWQGTGGQARMFERRVIFLGVQVDDESANDAIAQMLFLEAEDPDREINIYINSQGTAFSSFMEIYDTMRALRADVRTVCLGQAAMGAAVILAAGTPGKRMALPNSHVLIHQPTAEALHGHVSDLEIQARELQRARELLETTLAKHTNRSVEQVSADVERNTILTAEQAREYGIVDQVVREGEVPRRP